MGFLGLVFHESVVETQSEATAGYLIWGVLIFELCGMGAYNFSEKPHNLVINLKIYTINVT